MRPTAAQALWVEAASGQPPQVAAALAALASGRHTPPSATEVAQLLALVAASQPPAPGLLLPPLEEDVLLPALLLLSRWARQQGQQPAAARDATLLQRAAAEAHRLLRGATQPRLAAACVLLLGSVAPAADWPGGVEQAAEAVGGALLGGQLGGPAAAPAADAMAAVGALLPCMLDQPDAACWVLAALLQWLGGWHAEAPSSLPSCLELEGVAPAYGMMRAAAAEALALVSRGQPSAVAMGLLRPAYAVLRVAAAPWHEGHHRQLQQQQQQQFERMERHAGAAAAVLALGGLAEGLARSAAGSAEAAQLAAEAAGSLAAACSQAAAAAAAAAEGDVGNATGGSLAMLRDACSLASAQLAGAGVPLLVHTLGGPPSAADAAAAGLVRCQAPSLLHSALSLAPLCEAATARLPPAQASQLLQRQASCALVAHAGGMALGISQHCRVLQAADRRWLLAQVVLAAQQAHQRYRQYALTAPPGWLAAVDPQPLRLLLDRLFLSCLVLLGAVWEAEVAAEAAGAAAAAPSAAAAGPDPRARQQQQQPLALVAAEVAAALADLQFCRSTGSPQYAALLRAVLAAVHGDGSGAAAATLVQRLPCYADLAAPGPGGQASWLADGVSAATAQFVMAALVPCCAQVLPQAALEQRLAPLAFLYLLHPHPPAAVAAHQLACALLLAALEGEEEEEEEEVEGGRREPLAAYYVRRSLEGWCSGGATVAPPVASAFGQGLATVLQQVLPAGSPTALLCLQRVLDRWQELAAREDPTAVELGALAAQQLLIVDYGLLGEAMRAFEGLLLLRQPGGGGGGRLRRDLLATVRGSDDGLRKPVLARWLLEIGQ